MLKSGLGVSVTSLAAALQAGDNIGRLLGILIFLLRLSVPDCGSSLPIDHKGPDREACVRIGSAHVAPPWTKAQQVSSGLPEFRIETLDMCAKLSIGSTARVPSYSRKPMRHEEIYLAPLLEAALIAVIALAGWVSHSPLVFTSLGPTAFELIETPDRRGARPYNIIAGNIIAIVAAFVALWLTGARGAPSVSSAGVPVLRVWAAVLAAMLTVFGTLLLKATQPAALSTTLLISLGTMQTVKDAGLIFAAILLMTAMGEPIRRWRERDRQKAKQRAVR